MTTKNVETQETEEPIVYGALLLQLVDKSLTEGDFNTENGSPGTISFMDRSELASEVIMCSKYGVTVGITKGNFEFIKKELSNSKTIFSVKLLKFIPAISGNGQLSLDYGDMESIAIASSLSGKAAELFCKDDSRFN
jgi:hypothetical protein